MKNCLLLKINYLFLIILSKKINSIYREKDLDDFCCNIKFIIPFLSSRIIFRIILFPFFKYFFYILSERKKEVKTREIIN